MQTIVITGSTRGIGKGLAREFLQLGHRVVVTGRSQAAVDGALAELANPDAVLRGAGGPPRLAALGVG